jgi:hypothetical protein
MEDDQTVNPALLAFALHCLGPGRDAQFIAGEIVAAVAWRAANGYAPVSLSPTEDVCLVAQFVRQESHAVLNPHPLSWDAKAHVSCGLLQQQCWRVEKRDTRTRIIMWLFDAAHGLRGMCGFGPAAVRMAAYRSAAARLAVLEAVK